MQVQMAAEQQAAVAGRQALVQVMLPLMAEPDAQRTAVLPRAGVAAAVGQALPEMVGLRLPTPHPAHQAQAAQVGQGAAAMAVLAVTARLAQTDKQAMLVLAAAAAAAQKMAVPTMGLREPAGMSPFLGHIRSP